MSSFYKWLTSYSFCINFDLVFERNLLNCKINCVKMISFGHNSDKAIRRIVREMPE